ncbi:hypothetical protein [Halarcobacter sp.]|uniref:hypothetical protein n=1 Tax=Halarcobacter sp. TaxID=2321133 RepID=UPI002AA75D33|nr:hypothetical protein [Halarcobacter sp.]
MKKILISLLLFSIYLFANAFTSVEDSAFGSSSQEEVSIEESQSSFVPKNLYLSYINHPKHIYKNQRFEIKIKALITRNNFDTIKTNFINDISMTPLNEDTQWEQDPDNPNTYTNTFYFKAYEENFKMPDIVVSLYDGTQLVETRVLTSMDITFSQIAKGDEKFTNVIAKDFTLVASKSKQYTNKEALTILDIEAFESNLEDFNIQNIEDQGFTLIEDEYPKQHIIYYVVIPIHKKEISFTYYNTTINKLQTVKVPVVFTEELVSTQTDLNPNNSSFEFYKKVFVGVLALLFLLLFIWKRRYYILVLFLITTIVFIVFAMPNKTVRLKTNSVIYILPTKNSTIFRKVSTEMIVEDMKKRNGFIKIMFKSGNENYIGWVKEEDVIKN